jgi:hypothetical protein
MSSYKTDLNTKQGLEHIEARDEKHQLAQPVSTQVNVLAHLSKNDLISDVDHFIADKGLEDYRENLIKGAILAQNPTQFEDIEELSAEDKEAIAYEHAHRWRHPVALYVTIAICSLGRFDIPPGRVGVSYPATFR